MMRDRLLPKRRNDSRPDTIDAATLETDIALALSVISSEVASDSLKRDLSNWSNMAASNTSSNSNTANSNGSNTNTNQQINSNR
jgi:hypothetical protein